MTFLRDLSDLPDPPPSDDDTQPIIVLPQLQAHNAVPTVVMLTPEGRIAGEVMRGSFAHRKLLAGGYYEVSEAQS